MSTQVSGLYPEFVEYGPTALYMTVDSSLVVL
jgi:hypothetical protein